MFHDHEAVINCGIHKGFVPQKFSAIQYKITGWERYQLNDLVECIEKMNCHKGLKVALLLQNR